MGKLYTKNTWTDQVLDGDLRYDIEDDGGSPIDSNVRIDLHNEVVQEGSPLTADWMNNIETGVDGIDTLTADKLTPITTGGTSTAYTITTLGGYPLTTNEIWTVIFHTTAGTTPTLNRDGKGAKSLKYRDINGIKQNITAAQLTTGLQSNVIYDGTDYVVLNPLVSVAGGSPISIGLAGSTGLQGIYNASTPDSKVDFSAVAVCLKNPLNGYIAFVSNAGTITNDIGASGPVANGRDQSSAFTASHWLHYYWIYNGSAIATISSLTDPSGGGPTLPTGYTHWCYIGAIYLDSTTKLMHMIIRGNKFFHEPSSQPPIKALNAGSASTETSFSLSAFVPPNAGTVFCGIEFTPASAGQSCYVYPIAGLSVIQIAYGPVAAQVVAVKLELPNISQTMYYKNSAASCYTTVYIVGYTMPNSSS